MQNAKLLLHKGDPLTYL